MDKQYKNKNSLKNMENLSNFEQQTDLKIEKQDTTGENKNFEFKNLTADDKNQPKEKIPNNSHITQSVQMNREDTNADTILQKSVEDILSSGLEDLYQSLDQPRKIIFKQKGEETAASIVVLIKSIKFKIYEVLNLIRNWLFIIPGINKFFLEQEAKIKTDKVLELQHKNKNLK